MIKVIIAGDFSPMNRVENSLKFGTFPVSALGEVNKSNDLFILNFETSIAANNSKGITKLGPNLKCTEKVISFLKEAGVSAVTLANNHTMDYGEDGLMNTINLLNQCGIKYVGAGNNKKEAQEPLYLSQGEESLAIINCCEHEFSYAEDSKAGTNPLEPISQYYSIKEAKNKADHVIVIVHGGHEFYNLPSLRMQETYRFFIDAGADAVINHHQHCYSGFEYWHGKPIYYGLGNLCFDWPGRLPSFYTGYCVRLHLGETVSSEEIPYTQCLDDPVVKVGEFDGFRESLEKLNQIINDPDKLKCELENYFDSMGKSCEGVLTPFTNEYVKELVKRGYLPKLISEKKKMHWKAYIDCESHRDVMLHYLKKGF